MKPIKKPLANKSRIQRAAAIERRRFAVEHSQLVAKYEDEIGELSADLKQRWDEICYARGLDPDNIQRYEVEPSVNDSHLFIEYNTKMQRWLDLINKYKRLCKRLGIKPGYKRKRREIKNDDDTQRK